MSETDSFIDEVTEEVRRDRLFATFRKYGWIGIAAVVLIVGGAAWNEWQKSKARQEAQGFGDAITAALASDDPAARVAALDGVGPTDMGDAVVQEAVVAFIAADEALRAGDRAGALTRLEDLAADETLAPTYRQLAELKAVILAGSSMDPATRDATLAELATPGAPFRVLAMEQQMLALVDAQKTDEALTLGRLILEEPDATAGLRRRVTQLIVVLGGEPAAE